MRRAALAVSLLAALLLATAGAVADGRHDKGDRGDDGDDEASGEGRGEAGKRKHDRDRGDGDDRDDDRDRDGDRGDRGRGDRRASPRSAEAGVIEPPVAAPEVPVHLTGDAAVRQTVRTDPGRLTYVIAVGGLGAGVADDVRLSAEMPELGNAWTMIGAGASDCALAAVQLTCSFGDLAPGEVRLLQLSSDVGATPAWEVRTTAGVEAGNDGRPSNDQATTVVGILLT